MLLESAEFLRGKYASTLLTTFRFLIRNQWHGTVLELVGEFLLLRMYRISTWGCAGMPAGRRESHRSPLSGFRIRGFLLRADSEHMILYGINKISSATSHYRQDFFACQTVAVFSKGEWQNIAENISEQSLPEAQTPGTKCSMSDGRDSWCYRTKACKQRRMLLKTQEKKETGDRHHFRSMQHFQWGSQRNCWKKRVRWTSTASHCPLPATEKARQEATRNLTAPLQTFFLLK